MNYGFNRNRSMRSCFYFCFSLFVVLCAIKRSCFAQKIPDTLNKIDAQQKRQGQWIISMDALWQPTKDSTKIIYYRSVTYKDNKPLGLVTDYYRDGTKQYEGRLIEDRPEEIMDGEQLWYY